MKLGLCAYATCHKPVPFETESAVFVGRTDIIFHKGKSRGYVPKKFFLT